MEYDHETSDSRRVFGKTFLVKVTPDMSYDQVLERSLNKWENYDRTFSRDRGYVLDYPDGKLARTIPGSTNDFIMGKYKAGQALLENNHVSLSCISKAQGKR
jgi:hypothetical protein